MKGATVRHNFLEKSENQPAIPAEARSHFWREFFSDSFIHLAHQYFYIIQRHFGVDQPLTIHF